MVLFSYLLKTAQDIGQIAYMLDRVPIHFRQILLSFLEVVLCIYVYIACTFVKVYVCVLYMYVCVCMCMET